MQVAKQEKYKSGFPKQVTRTKHNLVLNERLKAARNRNKISSAGVVKELAKQGVRMGHSTLQGYEADENSLNHRYPSLPVLLTLTEFYGCSLDYLFGYSDRFKPYKISDGTDIKDLLESNAALAYNGKRLNQTQKDLILSQIDAILGN